MKQYEITDVKTYKLLAQNLENLFNVYKDSNGYYAYNLLKTVQFPEDLNPLFYSNYIVEPKDSWPLIAWKFYKSVRLWWLICAANNIEDPTEMPRPTSVIRIINSTIVRQVLSDIKQG